MEREQIIAVVNRKGGAGKTVTTLHLAGVLADWGLRVLLCDLDPQASLTRILLPNELDSPGIGTCLLKPAFTAHTCLVRTSVGMDLLPGDKSVMRAEEELRGTAGAFGRLARVLRPLVDYDVVLLDTPPGLNFTVQSAIIAAGWAILPTCVTQHDLDAFVDTLDIFAQLGQDEMAHATPLAIVPNSVRRDSADHAGLEVLRATYGTLVSTPIPHAVAIKNAVNARLPLSRLDPRATALAGYEDLAERVVRELRLESSRSTGAHAYAK